MRKRHGRPWWILLCAWLVSGVLFFPAGVFGLSIEDEEKLGREFLQDIRKHFRFVEDEYAREFVEDLGAYLSRPLGVQPFPFQFYLINQNVMNAFAGPGGHIFFFTGLLDSMDSVDELAAVACHEMGHVMARHISRRIDLNKKLTMATLAGVLAGILVGGEAAKAIMTGSLAAGAQAQLSFSREDERQADQLGFSYMRQTGFEPSALVEVLNRMQAEEIYGTDRIPAYLRTHPTGPERMANIDSLLKSSPPPEERADTDAFRRRFRVVKTILTAEYGDAGTARRQFQRALGEDPGDGLAHFGLGLLSQKDSNFEEAAAHLKRAMEIRPDLLPVRNRLAETYQLQGRYEKAVEVLEGAAGMDGYNNRTLFLLAVSYQNMQEDDKAIRLFERLTQVEGAPDEVYYNLGLSYGRRNRLALAHYNFGLFFKKTFEPEKARFHFEKAKSLSGRDTHLLGMIQKEMESLGN